MEGSALAHRLQQQEGPARPGTAPAVAGAAGTTPVLIDASLTTTDAEVASAVMSAQYTSVDLRPTGRTFGLHQSVRGEDWMSVSRLRCTAPMVFEVELGETAVFGHMSRGAYGTVSNDSPVDTSVPYVLPHGVATSDTQDLDILVLNVDRRRLAGTAAERDGGARLRFRGLGALDPARARFWTGALRSAARTFADDELFANDLVRRATLDSLRTATLLSFPIEVDGPSGTGGGPATMRRALAFIEEHAHEPIDVVDIADAARLSVRGLQGLFARELGTTPVVHLRRVRLEQVRRELLAADAPETLVRDVARRWGFAHLGRFATHYREAFGRSPREDLRA